MATKTVSSWSNALDEPELFNIDAPNDDQCGLFDVGAPSYDQCTPNESVIASPEAFRLADPVRRHLFVLVYSFFALNPHLDTLTP